MPFISFEGLDASGKSTQLKMLHERLLQRGCEVLCTRESGGTQLGMAIRGLVQGNHNFCILPLSEALLYAADRAQHVDEVIRPALERGVFVLSDRYIDSSLAFQGARLSRDIIRQINLLATGGLQADLTVLLDLRVSTSRDRLEKRGEVLDRIEIRETDYQEMVRQIYLLLAQEEPERIMVLDASLPREILAERIWEEVQQRFENPYVREKVKSE